MFFTNDNLLAQQLVKSLSNDEVAIYELDKTDKVKRATQKAISTILPTSLPYNSKEDTVQL